MSSVIAALLLAVTVTLPGLCTASSSTSGIPSKCGLAIPPQQHHNKAIIAHRGASFHVPEHTLAAYQLAMELGADYIEPDLVGTKDGYLVALHSMDLSTSTNVAQVFKGRNRTFSSHVNMTGYWTYDFTLADIQKLKVHQAVSGRSTLYDGLFGIPTLDEILDLVETYNTQTLPLLSTTTNGTTAPNKRAGVYAELKDPEWYERQTSTTLSELLYTHVSKHDYYMQDNCTSLKFDQYQVPLLVVQCFDGITLAQVHEHFTNHTAATATANTNKPPLVLLVSQSNCLEEQFWFHVGEWSDYLSGIGPDKACLKEVFMHRAREHELVVHAWTERPALLDNGGAPEYDDMVHLLCVVGVDGLFTEDVATMRVIVEQTCPELLLLPPTVAPTLEEASSSTTSSSSCPEAQPDMSGEYGAAAGIMGILIGSIVTLCVANSTLGTRCCGRRGRGAKRQLRIPQHDDLEMI
jgi:glycerophosphoryl diester phosphodiesterase